MPAASRRHGRPKDSAMRSELIDEMPICREIHPQSVYRFTGHLCEPIDEIAICREIQPQSLYRFTNRISSLLNTNKLIRLQIRILRSDIKTKCFGDLRSSTSFASLNLTNANPNSRERLGRYAPCSRRQAVATLLGQEERINFEKERSGSAQESRTQPRDPRPIPPTRPIHKTRPARSNGRKSTI